MSATSRVRALADCAHRFGADAARGKCALLDELASFRRFSARDLRLLHDTLSFLRAYPDSPDYLAVYEGTDFVHAVLRPESGLGDLPETRERFLTEAMNRGTTVRYLSPQPIAVGKT